MSDIKKYAHGITSLVDCEVRSINPAVSAVLELKESTRHLLYSLDEYGFRRSGVMDESPSKDKSDRAAFGCSHTFGYEIDFYSSWAHLARARNFGVNGGSPATVARLVEAWIPNSDVDTVLIQMPESSRREIYNDLTKTYTQLVVHNMTLITHMLYGPTQDPDESWKKIERLISEHPHLNIYDEKQNAEMLESAIDRIQIACAGRQLVIKTLDDLPENDFESRDGSHNGEMWHRKVAQLFERAIV